MHVCWIFVLLLFFSYQVHRKLGTNVSGCSLYQIIRIWHLSSFALSEAQTITVFCCAYIVMMPIFRGWDGGRSWKDLPGATGWLMNTREEGCEWEILLPWPHSLTTHHLVPLLPWTCLFGIEVPKLLCCPFPLSLLIFDVIHLSKTSFSTLYPCGSHMVSGVPHLSFYLRFKRSLSKCNSSLTPNSLFSGPCVRGLG